MLSSDEFQSTLNILRQNDPSCEINDLITYQLKWDLSQRIGPKFFESIAKTSVSSDSVQILDIFCKSISQLHQEINKYFLLIESITPNNKYDEKNKFLPDKNLILTIVKALLFHKIDAEVFNITRSVYKKTFSAFYQLQLRNNMNFSAIIDTSGSCIACEKPKIKCMCWSMVDKFRLCNAQLYELDLLQRLAGDIVVQIAQTTIEEEVNKVCNGVYEIEHLPNLCHWLNTYILPWLHEIYCLNDGNNSTSNSKNNFLESSSTNATNLPEKKQMFEFQKQRLDYYLHEIYGNYLIDRLFAVIIDFPESEPVVRDLKVCLDRVDLRRKLALNLRSSLEKRLLHPGVNTSDILTAYIQTVKTLRVIDPSGVLMDSVCSPVRQYLRSRGDTVRCIVSFITEGRGVDITDPDLMRAGNHEALGDDDSDSDADDNQFEEDWREWRPDPVGIEATDSKRHSKKSADIIGMLVEVYGSRELFVREYSQLLAERLLKLTSYEVENELRYLELLKLRFGESEMHQCEVMLKDVKDSHRIDTFVKTASVAEAPVSALVFSAQFWPQLKEEDLEWPQQIRDIFDDYRRKYESLKASRSIEWKPNLGFVKLELEIKSKRQEYNVSPPLAALIWQFQERETWTTEELTGCLKTAPSVLKRRLSWWCGCGALRQLDANKWTLNFDLPATHHHGPIVAEEEDEAESSSSSDNDREKQLEVFWPYIVGLLKNLDSLSAERIFSLLKMFGGQRKDELSLELVHVFLRRKVQEQLLIQTSGVYKLCKK